MSRRIVMLEPGGRGGVTDYTQPLCAALALGGRPVTLVTAKDHRYASAPGVDIVPLVAWVRGTSPAARLISRWRLRPVVNALRFLIVLPRIARLGRGVAALHMQGSYWPPLAALTALLMWILRVPLVYTAHLTFDRTQSHGWAYRVVYACAAAILVHTRADLARLPASAAGRATVVPFGDVGVVARSAGRADPAAARAALGVPEEATVVLLFGQLRPDKGIRDLLAATAAAPGVHAVVAGEERGGLAAASDLLSDPALTGRVTVVEGFAEPSDMARLFAAADVGVLPYREASQSGVLLMAWGFARPVVAYPVGGLAELIEDGATGWLTARADPDALAGTLREVVAAGREECARRGAAGDHFALERCSWREAARSTEAVYEAISARTAGV
jgi:glycosyltransferase involved in cell wall biosynthesis